MQDIFDNWIIQVRKGILELTVLTALADKDRYAYELVKSITQIPGLGISEGTIYPLLSRLRVQGLVATRLEESPEGPARKYYSLTKEGKETLHMMDAYLDSILKGVHALRNRKEEK
ncbi:MAG: PadR family transcriptional regulator [Planctomycetales bacterium]|nr:PadR family transcriptional regulator [Planctomycetales bacterium]